MEEGSNESMNCRRARVRFPLSAAKDPPSRLLRRPTKSSRHRSVSRSFLVRFPSEMHNQVLAFPARTRHRQNCPISSPARQSQIGRDTPQPGPCRQRCCQNEVHTCCRNLLVNLMEAPEVFNYRKSKARCARNSPAAIAMPRICLIEYRRPSHIGVRIVHH